MNQKKATTRLPLDDELGPYTITGRELGFEHTLYTRLRKPFEPVNFQPVINTREGLRAGWTKPLGGLWLATGSRDGSNDWDSAYEHVRHGVQYQARLRDDARVLVIKWRNDYHKILGSYSREVGGEVFSVETGSKRPRIGLDYEELAKHYDAVFLTDSGLQNEKARLRGERYLDEVSLNDWEIQSIFVMNLEAISLVATGN